MIVKSIKYTILNAKKAHELLLHTFFSSLYCFDNVMFHDYYLMENRTLRLKNHS